MYSGALVMPRNCVAMSDDEMMYLEGGMSATRTGYGVKVYFTSKDINKVSGTTAGKCCDALGLTGFLAGEFGAMAAGSVLGLVGAAIVAAKYEMIACNKMNGGKGAYFRMLMNPVAGAIHFNGLGAITPW